ncbi:MAG: neutral zinc metallopeptidase [Actinobacteria bacterium]|nr:neutral zinc metallopeptidase [Actinomycetota bacterium]
MRWKRGVGGGQIEDRRGMGGGRGGRGLGLPVGGGLGGIGLIVVLLVMFLGGGGGFSPGASLDPFPAMPPAQGGQPLEQQQGDDLAQFVAFVVEDVQDSWARSFAEADRRYEPTKLVLFDQATQSGCGPASAGTGPFYCPADSKVYVDLGFFRELRDRFGAPGDFAQAYVIAHEFGHHVQNLLGISDDVNRAQQEDRSQANELSVRLELQADCLAGVWAYSAYNEQLLEPGDVEEGLGAAAAVGDDRIQKEATGRIDRESWTHGSSAQRQEWFQRGFREGDVNGCNTFSDGG